MSQRRMFSPDIVASDAFLEMPTSSRELYFQLGMYADDDGFVNPKKIMRMIGASDDDLKVLLSKRFLLLFENGVVVIKHWLIHNMIRKDRYKETIYLEQKKQIIVQDNNRYSLATKRQPSVNRSAPQVRLGKVSIGKDRLDNTSEQSSQVSSLIDSFKDVNPSYQKWFGNKTQRAAAERLISTHGLERILKIVTFLPKSNNTQYMPVVTTPLQLEDKFAQLATAWQKIKNNEPIIL